MLIKKFREIKQDHKKATQKRLARLTIGSSVGRVFKKYTVNKIWPVLADIDLSQLSNIKTQSEFKNWFETQLNKLAKRIKKTNPDNKKIYPGYKWGHATKILCLFLHDIVVHRDFLPEKIAHRIRPFLYCPIDSVVMKSLKSCKIVIPFSKIKEIDTSKKFYDIQNRLGQAAQEAGVPRIWFDDNWGDRQ